MQNIFQQEFEKLMEADPNGMLQLSAVVEAASNPEHPFHIYFTWDDTEAAKKWRLEQAGLLVRSYRVHISPLDVKVRALTSLQTDRMGQGGFRWTTDVIADPDLRSQLLATALKELNAMESKYNHLKELARVWAEADKVEQKIEL